MIRVGAWAKEVGAGVLWVVVGCLALCVPHLASAPSGVIFAWSGVPYTGELVALVVLGWFAGRHRLLEKLQGRLPLAALASTALLMLFEAMAAAFGAFAAHFLPLALAEELLRVAAVFSWLLYESSQKECGPRLSVCPLLPRILFALGGALWYVASFAMRAGCAWSLKLELLMWAAALAWALPFACALHAFDCGGRAFWGLVATTFLGVFAANRVCLFMLRLGLRTLLFPKGWPVLFAGAVLAIVAFALLKALPRSEAENVLAEGPQGLEPSSRAALPLRLIPGYQKLSSRERQILMRTLEGATSSEVSAELGVAATTVRTYRARAYEKLGVAGPEEVLAALRLAIEEPVPMPAEPIADMSPAMRTLAERVAPPVACLAVGSLSAAALFATWALGTEGLRLAACELLYLVAFVVGAMHMGRLSQAEDEFRCSLMSLAVAAGASVALAAIVAGPFAFALRRTILAAAIVALGAWIAYRARPFDGGVVARTLTFAGLVGIALVPHGANVQTFLRSLAPFAACCALLAYAGFLLQGALKDRLAQLASVVFKGDARILAYLEGRGIPSLQAQVALLTARDYPLGGIAATLSLTDSAVTQSRMRTYRSLGVANKKELIALLARDAGLVAKVGGEDA